MRIPIVRGVIDRRILVNYRVDGDVLAQLLPQPFRPQLVDECGIAGICLIRLKQIRPRFVPAFAGLASENAAHRIAVEGNHNGERCTGVYVPRRDTSSRINSLVGGRLFPGVHHHARFHVVEQADHYDVRLTSDDDKTHVAIRGRLSSALPEGSIFASTKAASDFFERGSLGYSPCNRADEFDGLELRSFGWHVEPLAVEHVESSFFENRDVFPEGSVHFDSALLMRSIQHEWHGKPSLHR